MKKKLLITFVLVLLLAVTLAPTAFASGETFILGVQINEGVDYVVIVSIGGARVDRTITSNVTNVTGSPCISGGGTFITWTIHYKTGYTGPANGSTTAHGNYTISPTATKIVPKTVVTVDSGISSYSLYTPAPVYDTANREIEIASGTSVSWRITVKNGYGMSGPQGGSYTQPNGTYTLNFRSTTKLTVTIGTGVSSVTVNDTTYTSNATLSVATDSTVTWSATAATGYTLAESSGTLTMDAPKTLAPTASLQTFTFSWTLGAGVQQLVLTINNSTRTYSASGSVTLHYGDAVELSARPQTGFSISGQPSGSFTATKDVSVSFTAVVKSYTLSITKNTGVSAVTVNRTSSPNKGAATGTLSNGATIYYGDKLSVSATAATGYTLNSYSTSYTVSGNTTVAPTATLNSYTLTVTKNTGVSEVTVNRTSSPNKGAATGALSNGATIYYGDKLSVSATAAIGYTMNSYSTSYTVSGNITVDPTATLNSYTLTITQNSGVASITVNRTSSPNKGASTGAISNGSTIYYGDTLEVSATAATGFKLNSYTTAYTVSDNVTVAPTASLKRYTITVTVPANVAQIVVNDKTFTASGTLKVYHGDSVKWTATPAVGYTLSKVSGSFTATKKRTITTTATAKSFTYTLTYNPANATVLLDFSWELTWAPGYALEGNAGDYVGLAVSENGRTAVVTFKKAFTGGKILLTAYCTNGTAVRTSVELTCG